MNIAVIGTGNVGIAVAADLSIKGFDVSLIKTSSYKSEGYNRLIQNNNRVFLKENHTYTQTTIKDVSKDLSKIDKADVVIVTIQSTFYEDMIKKISQYLHADQVVVCFCSYMSSFYFAKYCLELPSIAETTGPYLEGRVELGDKPNEVVFRVGCRLERCPLSIFHDNRANETMETIESFYKGFSNDYSVVESALLNPNMVLHTVGSILSIPRIEYSKGNFCMYREAYPRGNEATMNVMLELDKDKTNILQDLAQKPTTIFEAGGFAGPDRLKSFYQYSESSDRAISPTSVHSRYITEDVSQGLVLLESIGNLIGRRTPIATALIDIASAALQEDFRMKGRTVLKLGADRYIEKLAGL